MASKRFEKQFFLPRALGHAFLPATKGGLQGDVAS